MEKSSDGLEPEALDALLVLAFLEEPPPGAAAAILPPPPLDDLDGPRAFQGIGSAPPGWIPCHAA